MTVTAVVGAQWGDEGKGKVVDYLARSADLVIRYNGGDNAGHTIVNDLGTFKLRLTPSGVFNPSATCLLGQGTAVHPPTLISELADLRSRGIRTDRVLMSERAHVVMPHHMMLEQVQERSRGSASQGSTGRGIAPAYADKADRIGLRMGDLLDLATLLPRCQELADWHNPLFVANGVQPLVPADLVSQCLEWGELLGSRIVDALPIVQTGLRQGERIVLEGQLGALRDLDLGIYP